MVRATIAILSTALLLTCCSGKRSSVVVGSKNFTEQVLLGEILAQQIERRTSLPVERKLNLGGTLLAHQALKSGGIDLYPEYTGTALTAVLKQTLQRDASAVLRQVRDGYAQWHLKWLDPLGFDNTFAMVVRTDLARQSGLKTLSSSAKRPAPWKLGVGYEFVQRPDGLAGLVKTYGLRVAGDPVTMDLGLLYPALTAGRIEMGAASATDGALARPEFTVLADDQHYFPPYECAIVVREDVLARDPALEKALAELSGRITEAEMRRMNAAVDLEHHSVPDVARDFLTRVR